MLTAANTDCVTARIRDWRLAASRVRQIGHHIRIFRRYSQTPNLNAGRNHTHSRSRRRADARTQDAAMHTGLHRTQCHAYRVNLLASVSVLLAEFVMVSNLSAIHIAQSMINTFQNPALIMTLTLCHSRTSRTHGLKA